MNAHTTMTAARVALVLLLVAFFAVAVWLVLRAHRRSRFPDDGPELGAVTDADDESDAEPFPPMEIGDAVPLDEVPGAFTEALDRYRAIRPEPPHGPPTESGE
jgi:hypothetical protein